MTIAPTAVHRVRAATRTTRGAWRNSDLLLRVALVVLGLVVVTTVVAVFTGLAGSTSATVGGRLEGASALAPLGTDNLGRSLFRVCSRESGPHSSSRSWPSHVRRCSAPCWVCSPDTTEAV